MGGGHGGQPGAQVNKLGDPVSGGERNGTSLEGTVGLSDASDAGKLGQDVAGGGPVGGQMILAARMLP
jgi:hypothetical protein